MLCFGVSVLCLGVSVLCFGVSVLCLGVSVLCLVVPVKPHLADEGADASPVTSVPYFVFS